MLSFRILGILVRCGAGMLAYWYGGRLIDWCIGSIVDVWTVVSECWFVGLMVC